MAEKKGTARPRGTDSAKVIQVIESTTLIGAGTEDDPCRLITQYWSLDGKKLAERDPYRSGLERDEQQGCGPQTIHLNGHQFARIASEAIDGMSGEKSS